MKTDCIIGIDPDCDKSGVAILQMASQKMFVENYTFPELVEFFISIKTVYSNPVVVIEAGWLNKSHFHGKASDSRRLSAAKGNSVGRNHETGRKLVEMAKHYGLNVIEQRPLRKCWKGPDGKITHEELAYFVPGLPKRTNSEIRDAVLLAWNWAGLPIKVKTKKLS